MKKIFILIVIMVLGLMQVTYSQETGNNIIYKSTTPITLTMNEGGYHPQYVFKNKKIDWLYDFTLEVDVNSSATSSGCRHGYSIEFAGYELYIDLLWNV